MTVSPKRGTPSALRHLVLRADASTVLGTGHVMRCLALAQAWIARGGRATLASRCESPLLRQRVRDARVFLELLSPDINPTDDVRVTAQIAEDRNAVAVVVDGYGFDGAYQRQMKEAGYRLAVFDDYVHADYYHADLVINQNLYAESLVYPRAKHTRLLLGTPYVILRPEFAPWREWRRVIAGQARRILVTLGGSDPANVTLRVIEALESLGRTGLEVQVIAGSNNPHRGVLEDAVARSSLDLRLEYDIRNMAERMAWADAAVAAAGTTCWELAFMGLPSVMIVLADNQRRSAEAFTKADGALPGGDGQTLEALVAPLTRLLDDAEAREQMSHTGRRLVDGLGADRAIDVLLDLDA